MAEDYWIQVGDKPSVFPPDATAELVARKNVANGYAGLDEAAHLDASKIPIDETMQVTGGRLGVSTTVGDMQQSDYDNSAIDPTRLVRHAQNANHVPWDGITDAPIAFPPSPHAEHHSLDGGDPVTLDWTQVQNKPAFYPPDHTAELIVRKSLPGGYVGLDVNAHLNPIHIPIDPTLRVLSGRLGTNPTYSSWQSVNVLPDARPTAGNPPVWRHEEGGIIRWKGAVEISQFTVDVTPIIDGVPTPPAGFAVYIVVYLRAGPTDVNMVVLSFFDGRVVVGSRDSASLPTNTSISFNGISYANDN